MTKKISELEAVATPADADQFEVNQAGTSKRETRAQILSDAYRVSGTDVAVADGGTGASTAADARTNLGVDAAGTDNSTNVTLAGTPDYITIAGQIITRGLIDLTTDVTGDLPVADGGTGASTAADARTNLGVEAAAAAAPILVTGALTLVAATHHRKTLEIDAASSPRITCAQIGAGARCKIHRPIHEPSPILLPPVTSGVHLGGADMGFNRIFPDGTVEIEYSNGDLPIVRGDLQWGGVPTAAEYASLVDFADLRRGEGLDVSTPGDPVGTWTSQGNAAAVYTDAGTAPAVLNVDGTIRLVPAGNTMRLDTTNVTLSGNVIAIAAAFRLVSFSTGAADIISGVQSSDIVRLQATSMTAARIFLQNSSGNTSATFNIASGQWVCVVVVVDQANDKCWIMTNSRATSSPMLHQATALNGANIPDWTSWTTAINYIGRNSTGTTCTYDIAAVRLLENADAAVVDGEVDRDFLLRLLGQMRASLPPGVEG